MAEPMLWDVLLLLALVVAVGVALQIGSSWIERVLLASIFCGVIVYVFYRLTGEGLFGL
jgi:hypothetical protein